MEEQSIIDLNELYEQAPCGYFSLSPTGKIIKVNQTLLGWLGYTQPELLNKKFSALLSKGGQMHFEMFFWPMATVNKGIKEFSYEVLKKDGTPLSVLLNATTKINDDDKLIAVNAVLTDITERKVFERELLLSKKTAENEKKRLQFMADLVPEIIWTATANGYVDYVNARFCQYFNCDGKNTRFAFILSKVHKDDLTDLLHRWRGSLGNGQPFEKQIRLLNSENIYEWHLLKAALFLEEDDQLNNWFGSCINIEDHVQAMKKKDEFINIASHELKTPITSLKALLQLLERLKNDPSNKMVPGLIEKANRNVDKLNNLVSDLLNASQLTDGQLHLNKTAVNLAELIRDSVHYLRINNEYEIVTKGDRDITLMVDEARIEQVITNFINNAIKYAPDSKQILICVSQTPDYVKVQVKDKGPGIPAEKIPHLFDRYYQVNNKSSKYSGLGLGLYICAEIIKRHGGQIGAESETGNGSTFWFTIPY